MELAEIFQRTHFYTRTKAERVDKLHAALGVSGEGTEGGHVENSKLALATDIFGEWRLRFSTPATTQETQVQTLTLCNISYCVQCFKCPFQLCVLKHPVFKRHFPLLTSN